MFWFLAWSIGAIAIGVIASNRERSGLGWFLLALLLSPLVGGVLLLVVGPGGSRMPCPACREPILIGAVKCRHCGEQLSTAAVTAGVELERARGKDKIVALLIMAGLAALLLVGIKAHL